MNNILQKVSEREICSEFSAKNFEILNFYGKTCGFLWSNNRLVIFPHHSKPTFDQEVEIIDSGPLKSQTLTAPKPIKSVSSYSGRVFIICQPTGIYKLSNKHKFVVLSETGIGLGCEFHQVLTPTTEWLYLADKYTKKSKTLFQLSQDINYRNSHGVIIYDLRQIVFNDYSDSDDNCEKSCLITSGKKLYKLTDESVEIIHAESNFITEILVIKKGEKDFGVGLITERNYLVLLLPDKENIKRLVPLRKVYYDGNIIALTLYCPPKAPNQLWTFHSNGHNIYHRTVNTDSSAVDRNENVNIVFTAPDKIVNCLKTYNDTILTLLNGNQLIKFTMMTNKMDQDAEKREFYPLKENMIKTTNIIVDKICERARELEIVNKKIALAQKRLERINNYAHKQNTQYSPAVRIMRTGGRNYLEIKLEGLPEETQIFVNINIDDQRLFTSKIVTDRLTTLEVPLEIRNVTEVAKFDMRIDLVATQWETQLWCILNNYVANSRKIQVTETSCQSATDRENLLTAKLGTLRSLIDKRCIDDVKLSYIKKSIRKD